MVATPVQQRKFDAFVAHKDAAGCMQLAAVVVACAGLSRQQLGETWGLTVFPSDGVPMRLNVGNREMLVVEPTGWGKLFVVRIGHPLGGPGAKPIPVGFDAVPDSYHVHFRTPEFCADLVGDRDFAPSLRGYARANRRNLPNSNRHNPLVNQLLDPRALPAGLERE